MPIIDIIILSVIVFAFLAFAAVLAWGDYQTKEIARLSRKRALFGSDADVVAPKQSVKDQSPRAPLAASWAADSEQSRIVARGSVRGKLTGQKVAS